MNHFHDKKFVEEIPILPNVTSPRQTFCRKNNQPIDFKILSLID